MNQMKRITRFYAVLALPLFYLLSCSSDEVSNNSKLENNMSKRSMNFPETLALPDGFNPEGIAKGDGTTLYVGSLYDGTILEIDSRTGESAVLVSGDSDRTAVGLDYDSRTGYLYVSGGPDGYAYIYDTETGEEVAAIQLTPTVFPNTFINDVIVTDDAAYFTNSFMAEFYSLAINSDGTLTSPINVETIEFSGDFMLTEGFNANGIVANEDGSQLIIVHSTLGVLYLTDPETGLTSEIDLGGENVVNGDGLVLRGNKLYVVQNYDNQISVIKLDDDWSSGSVIDIITDDDFQVPTTATFRGNQLYVVNAKFDIAPPPFLGMGYDPTISFEVLAVGSK